MEIDIIGLDDLPVLDILLSINRLPKTNESMLALGQSWQGGGKVATALAAAGRLGARAGIIGVVGADSAGRFLQADFQRHNVDTSHLVLEPGETTTFSVALAEKETQGRSFIGALGTCRKLKVEDVDLSYLAKAKYLHLWEMTPAAVVAARFAKEHGVTVVFDGDQHDEKTFRHLELIDVLIASEYFCKPGPSLRENCRSLLEAGPHTVVITLGDKGCVGDWKGGAFFEQPAFTGMPIVDTTGAGDVFHGAFICGLLQSMDIPGCARFASAVSVIKCGYSGGRAGIPDADTVRRFLWDGTLDTEGMEERARFYKHCPL